MKIRYLALFLLCFTSLTALFSDRAQAAPITGNIDFVGTVTFNTMSLDTATQVDLWDSSFVVSRTGDFTSVPVGAQPMMGTPWIFNTGTPALPLPGAPLPGLWSVGGFTFDLTTSSIVLQTSTFLNVTGFGLVTGNNFDSTAGLWSFTVSSDGNPQTNFSFQADTSVPEASTLGFLAVGAVGLIVFWRRQRQTVRISAQ
ncbi:MAG: PEP-CTERM sorting domain-containing protein [Chthoniobacterales bacterium]